jgi:hypothetical protein
LQLAQYNFGATNTQINDLWNSLYRMIFRANVVIDRATAWQPTIASEQMKKKQYIAEAKFLRALSNFNLVSAWGAVPLRLEVSTIDKITPNRAAVTEIWAAVEKDLKMQRWICR